MFEEQSWDCDSIQDDLLCGLFSKTREQFPSQKKSKRRNDKKKSTEAIGGRYGGTFDDDSKNQRLNLHKNIKFLGKTGSTKRNNNMDESNGIGTEINDSMRDLGNTEVKAMEEQSISKETRRNKKKKKQRSSIEEKLEKPTSNDGLKNENKDEKQAISEQKKKQKSKKKRYKDAVDDMGNNEIKKTAAKTMGDNTDENVKDRKNEKVIIGKKRKKSVLDDDEIKEYKHYKKTTPEIPLEFGDNEDNYDLPREKSSFDNKKKSDVIKTKKLTTVQEKLQKKLEGGRFRWINEQLYTSTGHKALELFKNDRHLFDVYHKGFGLQVQSWPTNPVHVIIQWLKQRDSSLTVADFGCGEAVIAQNVSNKVHSFDLVAKNELVTVCDMANVPLGNCSIDIAIFCLSLMGTNLHDFLMEAHRVLKLGGILKVAEVVSRFQDADSFIHNLCQLGFQLNEKDDSNKMFVLFEMTKVKGLHKKMKTADLHLKPCIYKKR